MDTNYKISIIIPVYNVECYLSECIESVINQTYKNIEVLLIDDGSTDKSSTICDEYGAIDNRVKVFHKENAGVSSARNFGIRVASGYYIGFIDSDDWINPCMYETMVNNLKTQNAELCICTKYTFQSMQLNNSNIQSSSLDNKEALISILTYNFPASLWCCLYVKSYLEGIFLNEDIHHLEDLEFQFKVLSSINRIAVCHEAFYNYRSRQGSANNSGFNENILTCLKVLPTIEKYIKINNSIDEKYISAIKCRLTLTVCSFLAKSNYEDQRLERKMTKNAREVWRETLSTGVSYKKKILICLLAISYKVYAVLYRSVKL